MARNASFLFVSTTAQTSQPILDPSTRYRCYHVAEPLSRRGHVCGVTSSAAFVKTPALDYDVYVFHRPTTRVPGLLSLIQKLKNSGRTLIADFDDLIFGDEKLAAVSSIAKNGSPLPNVVEMFSQTLEALRHFDIATASTQPLADEIHRQVGCRAYVVPNGLPHSVFALADAHKTALRPRSPRFIGYFSGTRSHDKDFKVAERAIAAILDEADDIRFVAAGPLAIDGPLSRHPQCMRAPHTDYLALPFRMSACSVSIAPLEDTPFNRCKSRVKLLEAFLAGCRLIATPIPDMVAAAGEGSISTPNTEREWRLALRSAMDTADRSLARANYEHAKQHLHSGRSADLLLSTAGIA